MQCKMMLKVRNDEGVLLVLFGLVGCGAGLAVMSVDLGSEWMKVAVVSVGSNYLSFLLFEFLDCNKSPRIFIFAFL